MVSVEEVSNISENVAELFSGFDSSKEGIGNSWEGESHDNFMTQAEFYTDYSSKLAEQLNSFAEACGAFKTYKEQKEYIEKLEKEMNSFSKDVDTSDYKKKIKEATEAMNEAKAQIESALSTASGITLEASKGSVPSGSASLNLTAYSGGISGMSLAPDSVGNFHQSQDYNLGNCGAAAFMIAVNGLLGENRYTDNVGEWHKMGSDSTTIGWGNEKAENWINEEGLQNEIEVTGSLNVHNKEELIEHLQNGETVVASSAGPSFVRNNSANYDAGSDGHYVAFLATDGTNCYADDPGTGPENGAGVVYTPNDLDNFFSQTSSNGSLTLRKK